MLKYKYANKSLKKDCKNLKTKIKKKQKKCKNLKNNSWGKNLKKKER